ncbi:MAG TPA: hypothetical protein VGM90_37060 [Kofleriaceae bacterium]|jgi:hypothetical protein
MPIRIRSLLAVVPMLGLLACAAEMTDDTPDSRVTRVGDGKADDPGTPITNNGMYQVDLNDLGVDPAVLADPMRPLILSVNGRDTNCPNTFECPGVMMTGREIRDGVDLEVRAPEWHSEENGTLTALRSIVDGVHFGKTGVYDVDVDVDWDGLRPTGGKITLTIHF